MSEGLPYRPYHDGIIPEERNAPALKHRNSTALLSYGRYKTAEVSGLEILEDPNLKHFRQYRVLNDATGEIKQLLVSWPIKAAAQYPYARLIKNLSQALKKDDKKLIVLMHTSLSEDEAREELLKIAAILDNNGQKASQSPDPGSIEQRLEKIVSHPLGLSEFVLPATDINARVGDTIADKHQKAGLLETLVKQLLEAVDNRGRVDDNTEIRFIYKGTPLTIWAQDPLFVGYDKKQKVTAFFGSADFNRVSYDQFTEQGSETILSQKTVSYDTRYKFAGGDFIIDKDLVVAGHHYAPRNKEDAEYLMQIINNSSGSGSKSIINVKTTLSRRVKQSDLVNEYPAKTRHFCIYDKYVANRSSDYNAYQPLFHLDLMLTYLGNNVMLLANARDGTYLYNDHLSAESTFIHRQLAQLNSRLEEVNTLLLESNFVVHRIPMPLIYYSRKNNGVITHKWYPLSYNNVIVEKVSNGKSQVWMPQYTYNKYWDKSIEPFNQAAVSKYKCLGFEVRQVPIDHGFAIAGGSLRCLSKTIKRN